ncbi:MAG: hypothetical protein F4106_09915 [Gemmatimonadetes bacterium]|nr:hypothetical protein [Gemmatimonadota bacterium]MXX72893.1 hypothetical protein [Gemmatimonadota bacterium]MYC90370.1 hypothetical protein [Gemmatimonadota bacterium]MYG36192.1 hypothetical protein [Gemmatimonadota bacterium]MYJ18338.1 hypothetical protein [Gemmatimonadota bacterium]
MSGTGNAFGRSRFLTLLLLPVLPVLIGCATADTGRADDNPMDPATMEGDEIQLLVRNLNFNQVTVYTARGASVRRLGIVPGKGEATFRMNWHLPDIQLRVKELAGDDYLTETLPVSPGDFLELILPIR